MLIIEQSELLQTLKQIVRGTEQFRLAKARGKLLGLPTGDGGYQPPALAMEHGAATIERIL